MSDDMYYDHVAVPATKTNAFISLDDASASARKALAKGYDTFYTGQSLVGKSKQIAGGQNAPA